MISVKLTKSILLSLWCLSVHCSASETGGLAKATHLEVGPCAEAKAKGRIGHCVPALTAVIVATTSSLSSRISKTGDRFGIVLTKAVEADGVAVLPEGLGGQGEVVHAKNSGAGVGGELILAARYLDLRTSRLKLRSMKTLARGKDQIDSAIAVSAIVHPIVGLFVRGGHIDFPAGSVAEAKTAEEVWIDVK